MAKKDQRFQVNEASAGFLETARIVVDNQTGVNYLFYASGNAGGLTPLLDRDGKPVITTVQPNEE